MQRRPSKLWKERLPAGFLAIVCSGLLAGCANPGPPRPPSLMLPSLVDDLSAERIGDRVLLRWTTPSRTTDNLDVKGAMTARICRDAGPASASARKFPATCATVTNLPAVPGASSAWDDLPSPLTTDPVTLLLYRVEILNAAGRSAGRSTAAAYAASGAAPPPVEALTATSSEAGAVLQWKQGPGHSLTVDLLRKDLSPAGPMAKPSATPSAMRPAKHKGVSTSPFPGRRSNASGKSASLDENEIHLRSRAPEKSGGSSPAGTVDTTAVMGQTYSYVAQTVRVSSLPAHNLELRSAPSPAVVVVLRDTFPPKTPEGLATVPGVSLAANGSLAPLYIDLSWEPNIEMDLVGYLVYRQLALPNGDPQGPVGKLTPLPIAAPAYRDVAVAPGQRYIYSITAVDASGNESAPSAKAREVATPQDVSSPQ